MSTAVAVHSSNHSSPLRPREDESQSAQTSSPRQYQSIAPTKAVSQERQRTMPSLARPRATNTQSRSPSHDSGVVVLNSSQTTLSGRRSPRDEPTSHPKQPSSKTSPRVPIIKKELPSSPESNSSPMPASRHRPRKLDLSRKGPQAHAHAHVGPATARERPSAPMTSKDSGQLSAIQDVGLACLSPGFQTQDPSMQQQLARSMEMRQQQRQIIEQRLHGKPTGNDADHGSQPPTTPGKQSPGSSKRKGPPPGLSINAPSASHFSSEPRVIQSAPLNQTFTGLKQHGQHPLSRQVLDRHHPTGTNQPIAHPPSSQSSHRLPPISDVFASENLGSANRSAFHPSHATYPPATLHNAPLSSPGFAPPGSAGLHPPPRFLPTSQPSSDSHRHREFRSAEEAVQTLSGGREELLPKVVHYGGHQPPTPPSPHATHQPHRTPISSSNTTLKPDSISRSASGRRRTRDEYERDHADPESMDVDRSGPNGTSYPMHAPSERRYTGWDRDEERGRQAATGAFGETRDSPETNRRKKEEFMGLVARAWDLFHS